VAVDSAGTVEIRRGEGGIRAWASEPGEYYNAIDGGWVHRTRRLQICFNASSAFCPCPSLSYAVMRELNVMTWGVDPAASICLGASHAERRAPRNGQCCHQR
jgi:hypothetical protein